VLNKVDASSTNITNVDQLKLNQLYQGSRGSSAASKASGYEDIKQQFQFPPYEKKRGSQPNLMFSPSHAHLNQHDRRRDNSASKVAPLQIEDTILDSGNTLSPRIESKPLQEEGFLGLINQSSSKDICGIQNGDSFINAKIQPINRSALRFQ
jgi:hypothetical protein